MNKDNKLKVGLVGIGSMGGAHYDCYKNVTDAKVVAVCDIRPDVIAKKTDGDNITSYTSLSDMITKEELDIIDICTPSYLHTDMAIKCLDAGFNVLCEKPMALNEDDCRQIISHAKASGKKFMTAHVVRFMAPYIYLAEAIKNNAYGKLVNLDLNRISTIPTWSSNDWMRNEELSGGVCLDLAVHDIDFISSVLGTPDEISSFYRPITDNSSFIKYTMLYGDVPVTGQATWYNADIPFSAEYLAVFENGYVELKGSKLTANNKEIPLQARKTTFTGLNISGDNAYTDEIAYFADCVKNDKPIEYVTKESSADSVRLARRILRSSKIL
ncbi:MAG: Gfo/Idh/MocA family oxidoreductase [Eubacteriales bacterium]|nr:Gfo/Idh/MocA family oxidoreductase [Eubacteriales bacterium]